MFFYRNFGSYYFQQGLPTDDVSSPQVLPSVVSVPDGYFYYRGEGPVPFGPQQISIRRTITGNYKHSCTVLWADVQRELRALVGTKNRLWRQWLDDPRKYEFIDAVFSGFSAVRGLESPHSLPVDLKFQLLEPRWHGLPYGEYNSGVDFQFDPARETQITLPSDSDITLHNPGNVEVQDLKVDVLNEGGSDRSYTDIQVFNTTVPFDHHGFTWGGTLPDGTVFNNNLVFRNREASISKAIDNVVSGAWGDLTLLGTARPDRILILYPGDNTIHIESVGTNTGGTPDPTMVTIRFSYYGAHA